MEEVVIVIADLYLTSAAEAASVRGVHLPGLARMARFGSGSQLEHDWRPWLAEWAGQPELAREAPATIAAASSLVAPAAEQGGAAGKKMAWLATPVHLIAGLSSVHLDTRGLLHVQPDVRRSLADEFNHVFADSGFSLEALASAGFLVTGPALPGARTHDPARFIGASVSEALPAASVAPRLRRLGVEIEMWLHEHRVNAERAQRQRLPVTALWLWGGGAARERASPLPGPLAGELGDTVPASAVRGTAALAATAMPAPGVAFGEDPYLHGLWCAIGASVRETPREFAEVLGYSGRRAVLVVELSHAFDAHIEWSLRDALADADRRWVVPALEALQRRDVARVTVVANDHKLSLGTRDRLKLWRVPRAALTALQ